jgi:ABC-type transport system involved in multi-copper enzyme maturation permease subunit
LLTGILYIGCLDTIALWSGGFANPLISLNPIGGYIGLVQRSEQGQLAGDLPLFLLGATVLHGLISYFFLHEAIRLFRSDLVSIRPLPPLEASTRPIRPALGDGSPLIWKDTQLEPTTEGQRDTGFFIEFSSIAGFAVAVSFLVAGTVAYALGEHGAQKDIGRVFRTVTLPLIVCVGMLRLTLRGATTISSERERQTLDSLLTTPLSNEEILRGKWLGCLVGQLGLNIIFVLLLVCGLLFWAMPPLGTVLIALDTAALWALVISLGMCVSVSSHSTFRATVTAMVLLLLITAGHWILYPIVSVVLQLLGRSDLMVPLLGFHADALTPPLTLATLSTLGAPEQTSSARLLAACVGVSLHVALAASLWLWLGRRFRLLSGRKE